jgi:ergothioneine biosynthesis glutamate--cysteine ligase EgtA
MAAGRGPAAHSATDSGSAAATERDDPFPHRPGAAAAGESPAPGSAGDSAPAGRAGDGQPGGDAGEPLSESAAEAQAHGICFKTGPPGRVGVELEWLVCDGRDAAVPVDQRRVTAALSPLAAQPRLPGRGTLTNEPGGQVEISSAPAADLGQCVDLTSLDLAALRQAVQQAGLCLTGHGLDPFRPPRRVLEVPRYAAMEAFFDRAGPWGRLMMCSTASVQVCLDAGDEGPGWAGFRWRWRLLHAIGPILVAAFANSPLHRGRPTGWKSSRQAIWARLDPTRTQAPAHAEPATGLGLARAWPPATDPRSAWVEYALAAQVMCVRRGDAPDWSAPAGLTFRDWLRGAGDRAPTSADLSYHLSTLFPPVRPRGHLEFRSIDAQPGNGWIVPLAVTTVLLDDPVAAEQAMTASEQVWFSERAGRVAAGARGWQRGSPWWRAARHGPADPGLAVASRRCFEAAETALARAAAPAPVRQAVAAFAGRYVDRGRCPADDQLDAARAAGGNHPPAGPPTPHQEKWQ